MTDTPTNKVTGAQTASAAKPADTTPPADLEFHPIANIFPLMVGDEFKVFKEDIRIRKQQEPIFIYENKVLDGRNRYNACKDLGLTPTTKQYEGDDPVGYVLSANLQRRHLNESQRAMIAAKLVTTNLGHNRFRTRLGRTIDQPTAGKMLNVSSKSVQRAKELNDKAVPELKALIESGEVAVSAAKHIIDKPKEEQTALAQKGAKAVREEAKKQEEATKKLNDVSCSTPKGSDKIDDLVDTLITKLQEMKPENAEAAVANLIERLRYVKLYTEKKVA